MIPAVLDMMHRRGTTLYRRFRLRNFNGTGYSFRLQVRETHADDARLLLTLSTNDGTLVGSQDGNDYVLECATDSRLLYDPNGTAIANGNYPHEFGGEVGGFYQSFFHGVVTVYGTTLKWP